MQAIEEHGKDMRASIRPRRGPLNGLVAVLMAVLVLDVMAAAVVFALHRNDPPVPLFTSIGTELRPGADAYVPLPFRYGFTTWSVRPQIVTARGQVRLVTDGRSVHDPDTSAGFALAALDVYARNGDAQWLTKAGNAVDDAMSTSRNGLVLHGNPPQDESVQGLPDRWVSSKTQGLLLSALTRLRSAAGGSGGNRWRSQADAVFDTLLRFRDPVDGADRSSLPWFSLRDDDKYIWFEQYPQASTPSLNVTGHLFALTGIYDYALKATGERRDAALTLFDAGVATVEHYFTDIREPTAAAWTSPLRTERSRSLHDTLIAQLRALARMSGDPRFREFAGLLQKDTAVLAFRTTGLLPRGDVDAYAGPSAQRVIPPTGHDTTDLAAPERAAPTSTVRPDVLASSALIELIRYGRSGRPNSLSRAERLTSRLLDMSDYGLVPHRFAARNIAGQNLTVPWYSAQTQGLLLSALVRLEAATGEQRWADGAAAVFATLQRSRNAFRYSAAEPPPIWLSYVGDGTGTNLWFDNSVRQDGGGEFDRPSLVVDAHLAAVFGVYDYWRMTKSPPAARLFDAGASTVAARFPEIRRRGQVSQTAVIWGLFRLDHHRVLTRQLDVLARMTANRSLARYAQQLTADAS